MVLPAIDKLSTVNTYVYIQFFVSEKERESVRACVQVCAFVCVCGGCLCECVGFCVLCACVYVYT